MHAQVSRFTDRTPQRLHKAGAMDGVQFREVCQQFSHSSWLEMGCIESNGVRHMKAKDDEAKSKRREQTNTTLTCREHPASSQRLPFPDDGAARNKIKNSTNHQMTDRVQ